MPSGIYLKYTDAVVGKNKLKIGIERPELINDLMQMHKLFQKIVVVKKGSSGADRTTQDYITKFKSSNNLLGCLKEKLTK